MAAATDAEILKSALAAEAGEDDNSLQLAFTGMKKQFKNRNDPAAIAVIDKCLELVPRFVQTKRDQRRLKRQEDDIFTSL
jgi:hypothetical protein